MATTTDKTPILESGDCLTRVEFERRYEAMPRLKKAELIDGVVYMHSAVRQEGHGRQHGAMAIWLGTYSVGIPGVDLGDNATLRLDADNAPQPDVLLRVSEAGGGQSSIDAEGYVEAAPELVAEVASSSVAYDLHQKMDVYLRHGVREYVVWRVLDGQIDWFASRDSRFVRLEPDSATTYKSQVFPGLWLDAAAMLRGDLPAVFRVLNEGLQTAEHAEFVRRLEAARK